MLRYLAGNADRLISKDELYQAVWPAVVVSDDSIAHCIQQLRESKSTGRNCTCHAASQEKAGSMNILTHDNMASAKGSS
jgi:hypothetical protein